MKKGSNDERCPDREWEGSGHSDERYGRNQQHVAYIKNHAARDRPSLRRSTRQDHAIGKNLAAHGSQRVRGDDRQQQGAYREIEIIQLVPPAAPGQLESVSPRAEARKGNK